MRSSVVPRLKSTQYEIGLSYCVTFYIWSAIANADQSLLTGQDLTSRMHAGIAAPDPVKDIHISLIPGDLCSGTKRLGELGFLPWLAYCER